MKRTTLHLLILLMVGWMGYAGYQIVRKWKNFSNEVVLGIHWKEVQWLCSRWNYPIKDFLQRAQPYGVSVIFGEDITLQDLVDQGTLLYFSGAESEKWKAFGLIDPEAPIRPRQLWVRETWLVARILQAARSQDIFLYTTTASNYTILEIPFSLNLKTLHVGIDETNVEWLKSLGFQVRDSWAAGREAMFSADGQEVRGGMGIVGSRVGEKWSAKFVQNISVLSSIQEVGQAMLQNPGRWLNLRLEIHRPIDENVEGIRRVSRHLLRLGFNATSPQETAWIPQISFKAEMHLRRVGALLLGCLAPLLGLRLAFRSLRWSFRNPRWPLASPAWEVLVAYGASIGVVCFFSFWVHGLLFLKPIQLGWVYLRESPLLIFIPVFFGFLALFPIKVRGVKLLLQRSLTIQDLVITGSLVLGGWALHRYPFVWDFLKRWRLEIFLLPGLFLGLWFYFRRLQEPEKQPNPRMALWVGLWGLASLVWVFAHSWIPFWSLLGLAGISVLWGAGIGLVCAVLVEQIRF